LDYFESVLDRENDPHAYWWSLSSSLFLDEMEVVKGKMNSVGRNLQYYNLFDEFVETLPTVTDETVEWFASFPGLVFDDWMAVKIWKRLLRDARSESACISTLDAWGQCCGFAGPIAEAERKCRENPSWSQLPYLLARWKKSIDHPISQEEAVLLLQRPEVLTPNENVDEYIWRVEELSGMAPMSRRAELVLERAQFLSSSAGPMALSKSVELAVFSADCAFWAGDFDALRRAIQFIETCSERLDSGTVTWARQQVSKYSSYVASSLESNRLLSMLDLLSQNEQPVEACRLLTSIVVVGGTNVSSVGEDLAKIFEVPCTSITRDAAEFGRSEVLFSLASRGSLVLVVYEDSTAYGQEVWRNLKESGAEVGFTLDSCRAVRQDVDRAVKLRHRAMNPSTCREAIAWSILNLPNLAFSSGFDATVDDLDRLSRTYVQDCARDIVRFLSLVDEYASTMRSSLQTMSLESWLKDKLSPGDVAPHDDVVGRRAEKITFPTPGHSSDFTLMKWHYKLPKNGTTDSGGTWPRIHLTTDTLSTMGKVFIGWVGEHR